MFLYMGLILFVSIITSAVICSACAITLLSFKRILIPHLTMKGERSLQRRAPFAMVLKLRTEKRLARMKLSSKRQ